MTTSTASPSLPAAPGPAAPPRFDFPTWLPPMLVKELRQGLRTRGFVASFIVLQVIMVVAFVWALATDVGTNRNAFSAVNGFFWTLLGAWLLMITPLRGMASLRQEIDARTLDLLILTRLTAWRIVLGKWASLMVQAALLVISLLPYGVVRYFFGSVNLFEDVGWIAVSFAGSALMTAIALWAGTFGKLGRVLTPIVVILLFQGVGMSRAFLLMGSRGAAPSPMVALFGSAGGAEVWALIYYAVLLLAFFLVSAVRRIAPAAENHAPWGRLLALAALLPVFVSVVVPALGGGLAQQRAQLFFGLLAIGIVSATELASVRTPWAVHVQPWLGRGPLLEWFGRFWLPGWPSAAAFAALAAGVTCVAGTALGLEAGALLWIAMLGWVGLVFPAVVVALVPNVRRFAPAVYFSLQGCIGILCIFLASSGAVGVNRPWLHALDQVSRTLPGASFWLSLPVLSGRWPGLIVAQAALALAVMILAWWTARPYWRLVVAHAAHLREAAKPEERA